MKSKRTRRASWAAALVVTGAAALTGCGQKGPLYLPTASQVRPAHQNVEKQDKPLRKNTQ